MEEADILVCNTTLQLPARHDKNGDGTGGETLFAKLDKSLKLDHNDFDMI